MESWIPLFVAVVGAIAAIGVAFWNTRGESAELRQLKAMNEVLAGMPSSDEKKTLESARNVLARRVARWVRTAPRRRRTAVGMSIGVVSFGIGVAGLVLVWPDVVKLGWQSAVLTSLAGVLAVAVGVGIAINEGVFESAKKLNRTETTSDPGKGRSA